MVTEEDKQTVMYTDKESERKIVAMDSAYDVDARNTATDVCVNASYCGVLPARFIADNAPKAAIGMDCGIGPEGSAIAGLWFLEALDIPAAVADVMSAHLGNGVHLYEHGIISFSNQLAKNCGVIEGMTVKEASLLLLTIESKSSSPSETTNRTIMQTSSDGRHVIATDSIAFGTDEDSKRNVLVTAGHTGRSAVPYLLRCNPWGFICSDGGRGMDDSGIAGLTIVEASGLAGATVDAKLARMGSGLSHYHDGVISAANSHARVRGVKIGMAAEEAASLLLVK
jgi:hypothetical protein